MICDLTQEIISWKIDKNKKGNIYYKSNLIPKFFKSIECYKKNFEPLLLGETYEQIKNLLFVKKNLTNLKKGKVKNHFMKKIGVFFISIYLNQKITWSRDKFLVIIVFTLGNNKKILLGVLPEFHGESENIDVQIGLDKSHFLLKKKISVYFFGQISIFYSYATEYVLIHSLEKMPVFFNDVVLLCIQKKIIYLIKNIILYRYHLKKHFNQSQASAIFSIFKKKVCLIQGPPGTGKTRTIVGIISVINRCLEKKKIIKFISKNDLAWDSMRFFCSEKLIICATSNTAIDENVFRGLSGFSFQKTICISKLYTIVRLGPNYHFLIDHVSFDNLAFAFASERSVWIKFWKSNDLVRKSRIYIWQTARIIYTTLACSSCSILESDKFRRIFIIDEAAQAIETSILVPLKNACKMIMVGDIQQLPATIFSKYSLIFEYNRSLFKRLQLQKYPVWFLKTQYRMHPQISSFPARKFYKNGLSDSENTFYVKNFHSLRCFGPLVFFDLQEGIEKNHDAKKFSWCNLEETRVCKLLFELLLCLYPTIDLHSVAFMSGYNGQVKEIQKCILNKKLKIDQQINTVDSFQGKEKCAVIFSCVRSRFQKGVGFLSDGRRINVAFTRAKSSFWCIGNTATLIGNSNWKEFSLDVQRRSRFFSMKRPFERSSRRLIYWSIDDEENYFFDGETKVSVSNDLLVYLKKISKSNF